MKALENLGLAISDDAKPYLRWTSFELVQL